MFITIIFNRHILTAGHCVWEPEPDEFREYKPNEIRVKIGHSNIDNAKAVKECLKKYLIFEPRFSSFLLLHIYLLLIFKKPVQLRNKGVLRHSKG